MSVRAQGLAKRMAGVAAEVVRKFIARLAEPWRQCACGGLVMKHHVLSQRVKWRVVTGIQDYSWPRRIRRREMQR